MNKILLAIGIIIVVSSLYGNIKCFIHSRNKKVVNTHEECKEYTCFVCRKKFETSNLQAGGDCNEHPLCSNECIVEYIKAGYIYEVTGNEDKLNDKKI